MTIAAGLLVNKSDALLFSDSMYAGWEKDYQDKIFRKHFGSVSVAVVLAGHEMAGKSAIADIWDAIDTLKESEQGYSGVRKCIQPVLEGMVEDYKSNGFDENSRPQFVVSITTKENGRTRLFSSLGSAIAPVDGFVCLGSGAYLAKYIISQTYFAKLTFQQAYSLAGQALAATKAHDASVDGYSQLLKIDKGIFSELIPYDIGQLEDTAYEYAAVASRLFFDLTDKDIRDEEFDQKLSVFSQKARRFREAIRDRATTFEALIAAAQPDP